MPPELSIVIPSHNRPDLLHACLSSVTAHAPGGVDIVVVDDGSPAAAASRIAGRFGARTVRFPRRRGFCAAANAGLRAAQAPVVELLNDDTRVAAGWAAGAIAHFSDPAVAAVAPLVLRPPARDDRAPTVDSAGDGYFLGGVARKRGHGRPLAECHLRPCRVFGASASSGFYRRDAVLRVGAFPEGFGAYFEDVDLAFRLNRAGYRAVFEPASRVYHWGAASHGAAGRRLLEQQSRNEEWVFWRNLPDGLVARGVLWHLAVLVGKAWRRWDEGTLAPFIGGRVRSLSQVRETIRHRRRLARAFPDVRPDQWLVDGHPGHISFMSQPQTGPHLSFRASTRCRPRTPPAPRGKMGKPGG